MLARRRRSATRPRCTPSPPRPEISTRSRYGLGTPTSGALLPTKQVLHPAWLRLPSTRSKPRAAGSRGGEGRATTNGASADKKINGKLVELNLTLMIYADTAMYKDVAEGGRQRVRQISGSTSGSPRSNGRHGLGEGFKKKEFDACHAGVGRRVLEVRSYDAESGSSRTGVRMESRMRPATRSPTGQAIEELRSYGDGSLRESEKGAVIGGGCTQR